MDAPISPLLQKIEKPPVALHKYILRNRELADYRKKANAHFLRLTKKIYQLKINRHQFSSSTFKEKHQNLKTKLHTLHPIANKDWLEVIFEKL